MSTSTDPYLAPSLGYAHVTQSEAGRQELAIEIARLEMLIQRALAAEQKEKEDAEDEDEEDENPTPDSLKLAEIATLQWPMIFGEACVLDPLGGSRGTVVADTSCEIFVVHRSQLQTFFIGENFIARLKLKALHYPDDAVLVSNLVKKELWKKLRVTMLDAIPKGRWPSKESDVEPMIF
jgi:hypothetical protein